LKILAILNGMSGVSYHRLYAPLTDLQIRGFADVSVWSPRDAHGRPNPAPELSGYDLVTWSGTLAEVQGAVLHRLNELGIPYIVDIDDYWMLNRYNPANPEWQRRGLAAKTQEAIFNADAVIVENERLGAMVGKINRDWHIVQNALDFTSKQWNLSKEPSPAYRVGFIGGRGHRYDLLMIADALKEFGEGGGVEINLCGYDPADREWIAVAEAIAPGGHPDWLKLRPGVHPSEYGGYYAGMDVVIAPLISNNFNAMKSDIKVKEAGAYCLPLIASDFGPYWNHESAGVYTAKNNREWLALLNRAKAGELDGRPNADYLQDVGCLQYVNLARIEIYSAVIQAVTK